MADHLTIAEAAALLGISDQAVHKRIRSGTLAASKENGRWVVDGSSAETALSSPPRPGRPHSGTTYLLMNGPYEVMEFTYRAEAETFTPGEVLDPSRAPLGTVSLNGRGKAEGLKNWWQHRSIPASREGMDARLRQLGLPDPARIPFRNLGLSLSDQYWIRPAGESIRWEDVNYFQNDFGPSDGTWDEWLAEVGLSSPDNTSEGVLSKRWICEGSKRYLLKGHIPWTDQQAYNEAVASLLGSCILLPGDYVTYDVVRLPSLGVASRCPCFVEAHEEYVPMSLVLDATRRRRGELPYDRIVRACTELGIPRREAEEHLARMIVVDSIMANSDRHLRNFGLIRDIDTLRWRPAPLFDTGNSLWYDKDEGAVARGDYAFDARPFDNIPARQLMYATETSWLDLSRLDGFAEEACNILAEGDLARWRLDYLREGIERRIESVREICG